MISRVGVFVYLLTRAQARVSIKFWGLVNSSYLYYCSKACGSIQVIGHGRFANVHGLVIGHNVHVNFGANWVCDGGLTIGDNVHFSSNCTIYTRNHNHRGTALPYDSKNVPRPVSIARNVWIGVNVTILPGTVIGEGAIVGGGAVVHGSVPAFAIIGAPSTIQIGERDRNHYAALDREGRYGGPGGKLLVDKIRAVDAAE